MPRVRFFPTTRELDAAPGARALGLILRAGLPIGRACEGRLVCGACRVRVRHGALHTPEDEEAAALARIGAAPGERLACAARVMGDVELWCAAWGPWR